MCRWPQFIGGPGAAPATPAGAGSCAQVPNRPPVADGGSAASLAAVRVLGGQGAAQIASMVCSTLPKRPSEAISVPSLTALA